MQNKYSLIVIRITQSVEFQFRMKKITIIIVKKEITTHFSWIKNL
jgi:hypothetical protein